MNRITIKLLSCIAMFQFAITAIGYSQTSTISIGGGKNLSLIQVSVEDGKNLHLSQASMESVEYEGKKALKVLPKGEGNFNPLVIIDGIEFTNGIIEIDLAGKPIDGMPAFAKGFIGVAFRLDESKEESYESFYLRPVNAIADNEVSKNRSVQYVSSPEYPWSRLREETPGKYETYSKMEPGKWITMKIVVEGEKAELYLGGDDEPCLTVSDLKHGERSGSIALWSHSSTEAYFRNLLITKK